MGFFDMFKPGRSLPRVDVERATANDRAEDIAFDNNEPPLTRDLILRFGGRGFIFNVRMWEAATRNGPACRYVPPSDHYRERFETLSATGVALRGSAVSIEMRLRALPVTALRLAAKDLGVGSFRNKDSGAALIAASAGAEAWLASRFNLDSFFLLQPEPWSYATLESLWHACTHGARDELAKAMPDDE